MKNRFILIALHTTFLGGNTGGNTGGGGGANTGGGANEVEGTGKGAGGPGDGNGPGQGAGQGLGPKDGGNTGGNNDPGPNNNPPGNNPPGPNNDSGPNKGSAPEVTKYTYSLNNETTSVNRQTTIPSNAVETSNPGAQLVILKPDQAPFVEKGYEIKMKGNEATLRALDQIDQNYQNAGKEISAKSTFKIEDANGQSYQYDVVGKEGGLVIIPSDKASADFADKGRTPLLGAAVQQASKELQFDVESFRTIFIDFTKTRP